MPYDDDKFGRIWPTRQGNAIGGARERQMLDAIGGSEGFRTRYSYNADGSTTEMRTKDGMPQFVTTKKKKVASSVTYESVFFCTPSSTIYQSGYTPTGALGPVSEWFNWHLASTIPAAHGGADPVLSAFAAYEAGADGAAKVSPGNITWYGDVKIADDVPVVLSWHGGGIRAGRYDRVNWSSGVMQLTRSKIDTWDYVPSGMSGFVLKSEMPSSASTPTVTCYPWVWIGGVARIKGVNNGSAIPVYSAGVRAAGAGYELVVISTNYVYVGAIDLLTTINGGLTVNPALDGTDIEVGLICGVTLSATYNLLQWPYMNAAATKAAYLVNTYTTPTGPQNALYEVDLVTGSSTAVTGTTNTLVQSNPASTGTDYSATNSLVILPPGATGPAIQTIDNEIHADQGAAVFGTRIDTTTVVAADYIGSQLVYLTCKHTRLPARQEVSINRDYEYHANFPANAFTLAASDTSQNTSYPAAENLELIHSTFGSVFVDASGTQGGGKIDLSYGSTFSGVGTWHAPYTLTTTTTGAAGTRGFRLYNADLRRNSYLFAIYCDQIVFDNSQWANGYIAYNYNDGSAIRNITTEGYTTSETQEYKLRVVTIIGGEKIYDESKDVFAPVVTTDAWSNPAVPYSASGAPVLSPLSLSPAGSTTTYAAEIGFAYTFWDQPGASGQQCPKVAHLTHANDGTIAYVGYTGHAGMHSVNTRREAFVFGASAPRTVGTIPANTYAPGSEDTLASPVFFPKRIKETP